MHYLAPPIPAQKAISINPPQTLILISGAKYRMSKFSNKNYAILLILIITTVFFPTTTLSDPLTVPNSDTDGHFIAAWDFKNSPYLCSNLVISAESTNGYSSSHTINDNAVQYNFTSLPTGSYLIQLKGDCKLPEEYGDFFESGFILGTRTVQVEPLAINTNNLIGLNTFNTESSSSDSSFSGCSNSGCPIFFEQHTTFGSCVSNCRDFSLCSTGALTYNFVRCEPNEGLQYTTCDAFCGRDYEVNGVVEDTQMACARLPAERNQIQCILEFPSSPDIVSLDTSPTITYPFRWNSAELADRYEWRQSGGRWMDNGIRLSVDITLSNGNNLLEVRACNLRGCGDGDSINVSYFSTPPRPLIVSESGNTNTTSYQFRSVPPAGFQEFTRAEWRQNNGLWRQFEIELENEFIQDIFLTPGLNNLDSRLCNNTICGSLARAVVTFNPPSPPDARDDSIEVGLHFYTIEANLLFNDLTSEGTPYDPTATTLDTDGNVVEFIKIVAIEVPTTSDGHVTPLSRGSVRISATGDFTFIYVIESLNGGTDTASVTVTSTPPLPACPHGVLSWVGDNCQCQGIILGSTPSCTYCFQAQCYD